jgi:hypothetical protein
MSPIEDYNYTLAMKWITKVKCKTNISLGSVQLGIKYANFYHDHIGELIKTLDVDLLNELKKKVKDDYEIIIKDCSQRVDPSRDDVHDNKIMISVILDFITSLHDI